MVREIRQDTVKELYSRGTQTKIISFFKHGPKIILSNLFYDIQYNIQNKVVLCKNTSEVQFIASLNLSSVPFL
jgi:hypothetical protein